MKLLCTYLYYEFGARFSRVSRFLSSYVRVNQASWRRHYGGTFRISMVWAICYAIGIAGAEKSCLNLGTGVMVLAAILIVAALNLWRQRYIPLIWQGLLLMALGMTVHLLRIPPQPLAEWTEMESVHVTATVTDIRRVEEHRVQVVVCLRQVDVESSTDLVRYKLPRCFVQRPWLTLLNVYLSECSSENSDGEIENQDSDRTKILVPGRMVRFSKPLRLPLDSGNPGLFDYRAYLRRSGITSTASINFEELEVGTVEGYQISRIIYKISQSIKGKMCQLLPDQHGLIEGLILGDTSNMTPAERDVFRKAGLSHVLSVSGLHVGLVYVLITWVVRKLRLGIRWEIGLAAAGLGGFVLLVGAKTPAVRASLGILGGRLLQDENRKVDGVALAAASSMVILTLSPLALFDVGFQLSYAAVLGIMILMPRLRQILPEHQLGQGMALSLAAGLATMPLSAYYFFNISVIGPISNCLVVPIIPIVMLVSAAGLALQLAIPPIVPFIGELLGFLVRVLKGIVVALGNLPGSEIVVGQPHPLWIGLYYISLFFLIKRFDLLLYMSQKSKLYCWIRTVLLVLIWCIWTPVIAVYPPEFCLTVVDVGQGDCLFIRDAQGLEMLIDGGGTDPRYSSFDVGERVTVPFLQRMGLEQVDVIVNTHPHLDHLSGLTSVVEKLNVRIAVDNGRLVQSKTQQRWTSLIAANPICHFSFDHVSKLRISNRTTQVQIIQPTVHGSAKLNDSSLVTRVVWGPWVILLMGDLEQEGVRNLLASGCELSADVLQIPHHGGENHLLGSLIDAVNPQLVFISVGDNNFGHPASSTLKLLEKKDVAVVRTDVDGAISFIGQVKSNLLRRRTNERAPSLIVSCGRGKTLVLEKN